jgi:hypothetical protein
VKEWVKVAADCTRAGAGSAAGVGAAADPELDSPAQRVLDERVRTGGGKAP